MARPMRFPVLLRWGHSPRVRSGLLHVPRSYATVAHSARYEANVQILPEILLSFSD